MSLKINYCRKYCAILNIKERNDREMIVSITEVLTNKLNKFDNELHVIMQNYFSNEKSALK